MVQAGIHRNMIGAVCYIVCLQLFFLYSSAAELCTKAVAVQSPAKRVHVLKRVPAACSNWDKSWTWLTKVDCGTKYKLDYVTVTPKEILRYKLEYVCCNGDANCQKAVDLQSTGFDTSDEKFLAIVLGSTAAAIIILVIVITISLCHKRRGLQCPLFCEENNHTYETAEDDPNESHGEGDLDLCGEHGSKMCESMYEEIADCKPDEKCKEDLLPRYTDVFKEKEKLAAQQDFLGTPDPFNKASAPPLTPDKRDNAEYSPGCNVSQVKEVLTGTAKILEQQTDNGCASEDRSYYNCDVKKDKSLCSGGEQPSPSSMLSPNLYQDCDSISNVSNCSNYEKLLDPVNEKADVHDYQQLLDKRSPESSEETTRLTDPSATSLLPPNGCVETANC